MARLEDYLFAEEFLFEGEQADEYKKRKATEEENRKKEVSDSYRRYMNREDKEKSQEFYHKQAKGKTVGKETSGSFLNKYNRDIGNRMADQHISKNPDKYSAADAKAARDAATRHIRRKDGWA